MWFTIRDQQILIKVFAKPHAKRTALLKVCADGLHISLHAKPHEGEANKALIVFIAALFKTPKSQVILQRGASSRHKEIVIPLTKSAQKTLDELIKETKA